MLFRMDLVEVIGKQSRKVPMLIPPDVKQALELLVSRRTDAGIPLDNPFVFAKVCVTQIICFWYRQACTQRNMPAGIAFTRSALPCQI